MPEHSSVSFILYHEAVPHTVFCTKTGGNNTSERTALCSTRYSCKPRWRSRFCMCNTDQVASVRSKDVCLGLGWQVMDLFIPWAVTVPLSLGRAILRKLS